MHGVWGATTLVGLLLAAGPAVGFVSSLGPDDRHLTLDLVPLEARLGYLDLDGDGQLDLSSPDEPVYLDLGAGSRVSWLDVRVTAARPYAAATLVNATNWDLGHALAALPGWLGNLSSGDWVWDLDRSGDTSAGDVLASGASAGAQLTSSRGGLGEAITLVQAAVPAAWRAGYLDLNHNGKREVGEPLFLDLDGDGVVSEVDLRVTPGGLAVDALEPVPPPAADHGAVERSELDALERRIVALEAQLAEVLDAQARAEPQNHADATERVSSADTPTGLGLALAAVAIAATVALVARRRP